MSKRNAGTLLGTVLLATLAPIVAERLNGFEPLRAGNPCSGVQAGNLNLAVSRAQTIASYDDSAFVAMRARYDLHQWPEDSVAATQDSTVCAHVDSLIATWYAGAEGQASGVVRNQYWGPTAVVRVNPAKYYVSPGLVDPQRREYTFVVDSVSGSVKFFLSR